MVSPDQATVHGTACHPSVVLISSKCVSENNFLQAMVTFHHSSLYGIDAQQTLGVSAASPTQRDLAWLCFLLSRPTMPGKPELQTVAGYSSLNSSFLTFPVLVRRTIITNTRNRTVKAAGIYFLGL